MGADGSCILFHQERGIWQKTRLGAPGADGEYLRIRPNALVVGPGKGQSWVHLLGAGRKDRGPSAMRPIPGRDRKSRLKIIKFCIEFGKIGGELHDY
jgi:hypothetical protein